MYPEELRRNLSSGTIAPVYFFQGDNGRLIEDMTAEIEAVFFASQDAGLDLQYYDAQVHAPEEILQSARMAPFSAQKRLVVVKNARFFKAGQWAAFERYLKKPALHTCLIFILLAAGKDKQGRSPAVRLKKYATAVLFRNPRGEAGVQALVRKQLERYGKTISREAVAVFADRVGEDAQVIAGEVEKLALYCADKTRISRQDVEQSVSGGHTGTIFNLVDGIGRGETAGPLLLLHALIDDGGYAPLVILKMIARQFRLISRARNALDRGDSAAQAGRGLGLKSARAAPAIVQQARGWPAGVLGDVFEEIFRSNYRLKASRIDSRIILENLILHLAGLRGQALA